MKIKKEEVQRLLEIAKVAFATQNQLTLETIMTICYELPCRRVLPHDRVQMPWHKLFLPPAWHEVGQLSPDFYGSGSVLVKENDEVIIVCRPDEQRLPNPILDGLKPILIIPEPRGLMREMGVGTVLNTASQIVHIVSNDQYEKALRNVRVFNFERFGGQDPESNHSFILNKPAQCREYWEVLKKIQLASQ